MYTCWRGVWSIWESTLGSECGHRKCQRAGFELNLSLLERELEKVAQADDQIKAILFKKLNLALYRVEWNKRQPKCSRLTNWFCAICQAIRTQRWMRSTPCPQVAHNLVNRKNELLGPKEHFVKHFIKKPTDVLYYMSRCFKTVV